MNQKEARQVYLLNKPIEEKYSTIKCSNHRIYWVLYWILQSSKSGKNRMIYNIDYPIEKGYKNYLEDFEIAELLSLGYKIKIITCLINHPDRIRVGYDITW